MTRAIVACRNVFEYVAAVLSLPGARDFVPVLVDEDEARVDELAHFANTVVVPWASMKRETVVPSSDDRAVRAIASALGGDSSLARRDALVRLASGSDGAQMESNADLVAAIDDEYALMGAALARLDARPFRLISDTQTIAEQVAGARTVAIIGHPRNFSSQAIGEWIGVEGAGATTTMAVPFGIVTGHSLSSVSRTIAKKFIYATTRNPKLLSIFDRPIRSRREGDFELLALSDVTAAEARRLLDEDFDLVTIASHGDPIDSDLNEAVLCGRPSKPTKGRRSLLRAHTCTSSDHCPRNRDGAAPRIPIDAIRAKFLASETCTGVGITDGVFPSELSLALGALEGVSTALLSTTKIIRGTAVGPLLIPVLAQSGVNLGDVCEIMKRTHVGVSADVPSYVLLGDPTTSLGEPSSAALMVRGEIRADEGTDRWTIDVALDPESRRFVRIDLHGREAERAARCDELIVESFSAEPSMPTPDDEMTAIVVRQVLGAPLSVLLFAARPFELTRARFRVGHERTVRERIQGAIAEVEDNLFLVRTIQRAAATAKGRHATAERQKHAADLSEAIEGVEVLLMEAMGAVHGRKFPVHALPLTWAASDIDVWLGGKLAEVDARLASRWSSWNMSHYLAPMYAAAYVSTGDERVNQRCYLCAGAAFDLTMRSPRRPSLCRTISHCGRCGILSDRPRGEAILEVRGSDTVRRGERLSQRLCITNSSNHARAFAAAGSIEGAYAWFSGQIEPTHAVATVPADASSELEFELVTDASTTPGTYNCVFFATSRLATSVSVKPITITA